MKNRIRPAAILALTLLPFPAAPDVIVHPPSLAELRGAYVGAVAGSTVQRLVLERDGTGTFVDVWSDSSGDHGLTYDVHVVRYKGWKIQMRLTRAGGGSEAKAVYASGDAAYFEMNLELGATERYRSRQVHLFREETFESMLEYARKLEHETSE